MRRAVSLSLHPHSHTFALRTQPEHHSSYSTSMHLNVGLLSFFQRGDLFYSTITCVYRFLKASSQGRAPICGLSWVVVAGGLAECGLHTHTRNMHALDWATKLFVAYKTTMHKPLILPVPRPPGQRRPRRHRHSSRVAALQPAPRSSCSQVAAPAIARCTVPPSRRWHSCPGPRPCSHRSGIGFSGIGFSGIGRSGMAVVHAMAKIPLTGFSLLCSWPLAKGGWCSAFKVYLMRCFLLETSRTFTLPMRTWAGAKRTPRRAFVCTT